MKTSFLCLGFILCALSSYSQDVITWSSARNGAKVADTVALEDYLPVKDKIAYVEVVVTDSTVSKKELYSRAKLAIQKIFASNKLSSSNYDDESGIVSVNNFYEVSDITAFEALSSNPARQVYAFNALFSIIVKDGKYKLKMEVPTYTFGEFSNYRSYSDYQSRSLPIATIANKVQNMKRQRMRVLKTLNDNMLLTFNNAKKEMSKKLDTDF
jgi:hypothetical protein